MKKPMGGSFMDVIRCDEPDYLIWKWHPSGSVAGENRKENQVRWGSSLRVKDGSVAVFVYNQGDNVFQDFVVGPFDEILKTNNLPVISRIVGLAYGGESPFQAEVYFINLAKIVQTKFAVPYFDVYDPRFTDFGVPVAVRGTITYCIKDYREFIKLHRLDSFNTDDFTKQIRDAVNRYAKSIVATIPTMSETSVLQLEQKLPEINDKLGIEVSERFSKDFGVSVSGVDVSAIDIDKTSPNYQQLKAITQDVTTAKVVAQTEADIKTIADLQRINMQHYEGTKRIEREEGQYARHMQTQSSNIGAFQIEKQAEVGIAGANALGQMGANGAGSVDLGGSSSGGTGFNPAAMMASMAVGSVVGQNIAGAMNTSMAAATNAQTPPPIPVQKTMFNVAIDGKPEGPFDIDTLSRMAQAGRIGKDTLVWKPGMSEWMRVSDVPDLGIVINSIPPVIEEKNDG